MRKMRTAVLAAGLVVATGAGVVMAADNDPQPPDRGGSGPCGTGEDREQMLEGGYEEIDGQCLLTGWNWNMGGLCPGQRSAEVGRYGEGTCEPSGGGGGGGGAGGGGSGQDPEPGDVPWPDDVFSSWDSFAGWCHANGGTIVDFSLGSESIRTDSCMVDGVGIGTCSAEADLEDPEECFLLNGYPGYEPPPHEHPGPSSTVAGLPGQIELPGDLPDEAAPTDVGGDDDPTGSTEPAEPTDPTVPTGTMVLIDVVDVPTEAAPDDD